MTYEIILSARLSRIRKATDVTKFIDEGSLKNVRDALSCKICAKAGHIDRD